MAECSQPTVFRDEKFYHSGSFFIFRAENTLFRVPQYPLVNGSEVFRSMFDMPLGDGGVVEGQNDSSPIRLEGVSAADFRAFLMLLCPSECPSTVPETMAGWKSILKLSSMWMFDSVRAMAIMKLDRLLSNDAHAIENIVLGKKYKVGAWLLRGYNALVRLPAPPTNEEADLIGLISTINVFRLRERYQTSVVIPIECLGCHRGEYNPDTLILICGCGRRTPSSRPCPPRQLANTITNETLDTELRQAFATELAGMPVQEKRG